MAITIYPDGKIIDSNGRNINQALMMVDQWRRTATLNTSAGENFITSDSFNPCSRSIFSNETLSLHASLIILSVEYSM